MLRSTLWLLLVLLGLPPALQAQFVVNGNASNLGDDCFEITPPLIWQSGSVWHPTLINLNRDFAIRSSINFGSIDVGGADGLALVLQPISTALGSAGGGMGYAGVSPSLAIEFDTYQNVSLLDPVGDHLAIQRDGDLDHGSSACLVSPTGILATSSNVEDGMDHSVLITWDADANTMQVEVDCNVRITFTEDVVASIFGGNPEVFIGFTGSTGGLVNEQTICFEFLDVGEGPTLVETCAGAPVVLDGPAEFSNYSWSPSSNLNDPNIANPLASPNVNTTYVVSFEDECGNNYRDTFLVQVSPGPAVDLGPDLVVCDGDSAVLSDPAAVGTLLWSDGSNAPALIASPGIYWLQVSFDGCIGADTVQVFSFSDATSLGPDISICPGDSTLLGIAFNPSWTYSWSDGTSEPAAWLSVPGQYILTVASASCSASDTIVVSESPVPIVSLPDSLGACVNEPVQIMAAGNASEWVWSTGYAQQSLFAVHTADRMFYWVEGFLDACSARDTAFVFEASSCSCRPTFPNAFSPNGDGLNDVFRGLNVSACPLIARYQLRVFNRWGDLVFHTKDPFIGWDGSFRGQRSELSSYIWMAEWGFPGEETIRRQGTVTVVD